MSIDKRIALLLEIKDCLLSISKQWAETAGREKGDLPPR